MRLQLPEVQPASERAGGGHSTAEVDSHGCDAVVAGPDVWQAEHRQAGLVEGGEGGQQRAQRHCTHSWGVG